ncbi:MAG: hypothetical protein ACFKPT_10990 [Gloeotrichia echinulata GP01]
MYQLQFQRLPHKHFTPPLNPRTASSPGKFCLDIAGDWGHNDRSVHRWGHNDRSVHRWVTSLIVSRFYHQLMS